MSGGITQLVAIGAQDAHLVGNPEVSFFRSTYRRHTNFSQVVDRQIIQGNPANNGMSTVRFERKGDMLGYVYFTVKTSGGLSSVITGTLINKVELLIGGQVIDEQDREFSSNIADNLLVSSQGKVGNPQTYFYPLHFFFCENWQSALPLIALQYHDVELRITWGTDIGTGTQIECHACYAYLDTQERQAMANEQQNMLITQTQKISKAGPNARVQEMNLNHPVKFLAASSNLVTSHLSSTLKLQLNGSDVSNPKPYTPHFNLVPFYHHCPFQVIAPFNTGTGFLYPFCLETNKLQPTGTLNFSRLDSARFVTDDTAGFNNADIYAVNYNILRIQNGMGGLMYAN
jgi:hypothetical protein